MNGSKRKLIFLLFTVTIVVIGVGILCLPPTNTANNDDSPVPSSTNLNVGDYAKYTTKTYLNGIQTSEYPITWEVSEEVLDGTNCFVINVTAVINEENSTTTTIIYWYMNKTTSECISMKTQTFVDNILVSEYKNEYGSPPAVINPQTIIGKETITVPAATFICDKAVVKDENGSVSNLWYNADIPIVGLAKMELYEENQLMWTRELVAYKAGN